MEPIIKSSKHEILDNILLYEGAIANKNTIYLTGYFDFPDDYFDCIEDTEPYIDFDEDNQDWIPRKPVYKFQRDAEPDKKLQLVTTLQFFTQLKAEMSYQPKEQCIIYSLRGQQIAIEDMKVTNEDEKSNKVIQRSRCINGKIHSVKSLRRVQVRNEQGELEQITHDMYEPYELEEDGERNYEKAWDDGFHDIDGFDANHLYAVGGRGDVWRCINGEWTRCGFPSNLHIETVCCGEDGLVYISSAGGGITFVGKEDSWTQLEDPELSLGFKNLVWHNGKVWATNDWGIWWITPEGITCAKDHVPDGVYCCAGRMHANAGMLLVVGINGAALHVDGEWELLVQ